MEITFLGTEKDLDLLWDYGFYVHEYVDTIVLEREDIGSSYIVIYKDTWEIEKATPYGEDFDLEEVLMPLIEDDLVAYGMQVEVELEDVSGYVA